MQNYTKIQKFLSFLLIFSILFSFTFHVTFFTFLGTIFAADSKNYNLVSIFVQEEIYSGVKNSIDKYARNIQWVLENTKTMIIPIPGNTHPFNIASLNEKLYFEWYNGLDGLTGNSRLIWSVFVWDLALPVVENGGSHEKTVFPYVDFDEKLYIYNETDKIYKLNKDVIDTPKAEIWHWFISPNTWNRWEDIKEINDYFAKNNDFYQGNWLFENAKWIMNGNMWEDLMEKYEPYVFYYDQIRETKSVKYVDYKAYEGYLQNKEDLVYNRFSSELAEKLKANYFAAQGEYIWDIGSIFWSGVDLSEMLLGPTTVNIPDVQLRHIIKNTTKNFLQIFNESALGEMRKNVHNAGRYNSWSSQVNVDLIPALLTNLDTISDASLKNVNTDLEKIIDSIVKQWLSRNIAVPSEFQLGNSTYTNFLYGMQAKDILTAGECSFYRGSSFSGGQLVESNRAFNINNVEPDIALCRNAETRGYWGGNSPLNLDVVYDVDNVTQANQANQSTNIYKLKFSDTTNAITPLYDVLWGLKIADITKNPKPEMCFTNNLILTKSEWWDEWQAQTSYSVPINGNPAIWWNCNSTNIKYPYAYNFDETYKKFPITPLNSCEEHFLKLDGVVVKSLSSACWEGGGWNGWWYQGENFWGQESTTGVTENSYNFHKLASYIEHKSPNSEELYKQTQYMISPNLPIDKNRYIDFIAADNTYGKIEYPYLFRVTTLWNNAFTLENAKNSLKEYLDQKSREINTLINQKDPSKLTGEDQKIYELLKTGLYPQANIDLYAELLAKPDKEVEILWDKKTLSYVDTLVFSILWNNLTSVSAKYKFIFENYLSDQFGGNDFNFYLPRNKKMYEIAYLWAPWDSKNMYVKLDPEEKGENPYLDIIAANQNLNNYLLSIKDVDDGEALFKCAPPEWVPIWKWIPAVICRLKDMLPPKISINDGNCWLPAMNFYEDMFASNSNQWVCTNCDDTNNLPSDISGEDINKNGIPDVLEKAIKNATLHFQTDSIKYPYNKVWFLDTYLADNSWSVLTYDSFSEVKFELIKLEIPNDENKEFLNSNIKTIFDTQNEKLQDEKARKESQKYFSFSDIIVKLNRGKFRYNFSTKSKDANVTLKATLTLKSYSWEVIEEKQSQITFQVRGDVFHISTYKLWSFENELSLDVTAGSVSASKNQNVFIMEESFFLSQKNNLSSLGALSLAKEKLFITLSNQDKKGNKIAIRYPLSINIYNQNNEKIIDTLSLPNANSAFPLWDFKEAGVYRFEIKDSTGFIIKKYITILPDTAVKIEPQLSTNLMEKWWVITTHVFSIYDQYDNPASGEFYTVEAEISGNSVVFENNQKKQTFQVYDAYRAFRLQSTPISGDSNITFRLKLAEKILSEKVVSISVVDRIAFELSGLPSEIKVGNNEYSYSLTVQNQNEKTAFNSRAYLVSNGMYLTSNENYINIQNGVWSGSFKTKTKSWEKIQLEFKIEWVKNSVYKEINILPEVWLKIDLTLSKAKIEANSASISYLYAEIKDRYGNVAWNDTNTQLNLEILPQYRNIIQANTSWEKVKKGKATFILSGTDIPGTAYFKVWSTPSLSENKIEIIGQSPFAKEKLDTITWMREWGILTEMGKKFFTDYDTKNYRFEYFDLEILKSSQNFKDQNILVQNKLITLFQEQNTIVVNWVWENVWKIESFYFWNKEKIDGNKYNSLYTTLLWSNYGDITIKDNLANSIIFDKNNKALWVTTLLTDPTKYAEILNIHPNGNLVVNNKSGDISQDVSSHFSVSKDWDLEVSFYNNTFWTLAAKIFYTFKKWKLIDKCQSASLVSCYDKTSPTIFVKSLSNNYSSLADERNGLRFMNAQNTILFEVSPNGKMKKSNDVTFELNKNSKEWLSLNLKVGGQIVWNAVIYFPKENLKIIRDISLQPEVTSTQTEGWMIIYLEARDYFYKSNYLWSSTKENIGYTIAYNDPFASNTKSVNQFWTFFEFWYERFESKDGLWWKEDNKILLSFAAGKTIGQATKDFMTFGLINIWDPVASLKPIPKKLPGTPKTRKYDATIWYLVSKDSENLWYNIIDYNNDGEEDIVILKRWWYIELLEGTWVFGDFINRGNLVYIADINKKSSIITWDFFGDTYEDIVLLNKDREIILLSNREKDFKRIQTNITLNWTINQIIAFDMDLDGKMDLVILDDVWDLHIFYGTATEGRFDKKLIDSWLWIRLNGEIRKDLWALYYDGLYQIPKDKTLENLTSSEELLQELKKNSNNLSNNTQNQAQKLNEGLIDKLVFTQMNYTPAGKRKNEVSSFSWVQLPFELPDSIMTPEMISWLQDQQKSVNDVIKTLSGTSTQTSPDLSDGVSDVEKWIQDTRRELQDLFEMYQNDPNIQIWSEWTQISNDLTTFVKSEYAEYNGIEITKKYTDVNGNILAWWDSVKLTIQITNNNTTPLKNIAYTEKIYDIFSLTENSKYSLKIWQKEIGSENIILQTSPSSEYTFLLDSYMSWDKKEYISLLPGQKLELTITLTTKTFEYWYIDAWFFDNQTEHGDIIFKDKNENCWQEIWLYKSIAKRDYEKTIHTPSCENDLPDELEGNAVDADGNGIPDYIDALLSGSWGSNIDLLQQYAQENLNTFNNDISSWGDENDDFMNSLDKINQNVDKIMADVDTILAGLSCWFGGWGCISMPLNWAPLAPWNDPTLFGMPVWDGLHVWEWLPIFSAMNWKRVGKKCVPMPWPPAVNLPWCFGTGAGGRLWTLSPTNFIRVFVTPTLTGAVGIAVCFWAPPIVAGNSNPMGLHPFVPGGNCVVAATPVFGCKNDGSDGEIYNLWDPNAEIINWNCSGQNSNNASPYLWEKWGEYVNYKNTGNKSSSLDTDLENILSTIASGPTHAWKLPNNPLLTIGNGGKEDIGVDIDFWALKEWNFQDVVNVSMTRISPFPDFIMEWVTRQIEEIANKLTDFPTLYIILPDFNWVFDSDFSGFLEKLKWSYSAGEETALQKQENIQAQIDAKNSQLSSLNCDENMTECLTTELEVSKLQAQKNLGQNKSLGGIKAAYEFLSNMPIVKIEPQKVNFNIPWIDKTTLDKAIADFEATKLQRTQELERAKKQRNIENYNCVETSSSQECKNIINAQALISSIDRNIEILKSYKNIPEDIYKMLKIKDVRIEQILCNIETISKITGWRIGENGKRFKAWVELYVLIKAILKSWQLLIDVFVDFDAECHQCKNERYDLQYFIWKLISMVLPKIPVIQFPKWPDIYLDLHDIRVSLVVWLPEFEFNLRPIVLPTLPNLYLPNSPSLGLNLPSIPLLPEFELPTLPDLPSLPNIELPNLPPPPKLPKLLSAIEAFLNILKIITKVMCILKTSPFVPEWRAWDQIAFITERTGYLWIDFLDMSLPQFSFPFVDAIKVSTFVNLELEIEFLVEMARQMALPINAFGNDIANMLNIWLWDLDLRWATPEDIQIDVERDGSVETSFHMNKEEKITLLDLASVLALEILKWYTALEENSKIELTSQEFKGEIIKQLPNIENEKMVWVWNEALNYSFTKENEIIQSLLLNNEEKYMEVQSILQEEREKNIELLHNIQKKWIQAERKEMLVNFSQSNTISSYNSRLEPYTKKAFDSLNNLFVEDSEVTQIRAESKQILAQVQSWLDTFSNQIHQSRQAFENIEVNPQKLLATNIWTQTSESLSHEMSSGNSWNSWVNSQTEQACSIASGSKYSYVYKGIYIIEKFLNKKISYYLFDYLDEVTGKEVVKEADFDNDGDEDIIYMVGDEIYLKQNHLSKKVAQEYYTGTPIVLSSGKNNYIKGNFIPWVNGFNESVSDSNFINIWFQASQTKTNYRIEFFQIVDKFDDMILGNLPSYFPKNVKKYMIDAFSDISNITLDMEKTTQNWFISRKNLAYIDRISSLAGVHLYTKELISLSDDLSANKEITINAGTKIYTGNDTARLRYYFYKERNNELKMKEVKINALSNIEFKDDIVIVWIVGNAYVEWNNFVTLTGNQIVNYLKKPLFFGSIITYKNIEVARNSYMTIKYYDGSEADINFQEIQYYELYDLWAKQEKYSIRTKMENDFYYAKIRSFKNNVFSTYSNQILLSPQNESDTKAPEISQISSLKVPVYSRKIFNISEAIFENSGNNNIKDIYIDFDLNIDSSWDGNKINDRDFALGTPKDNFKIIKEGSRILLQVGAFEELMNKQIRLYVVDGNNNIWAKNINFIVYSPIPRIESIQNNSISGMLDEPLVNEPVSFYRLRNNELTRLEDYNKNRSVNTIESWKFIFNTGTNASDAVVTYSGNTLFSINEKTGKINISDISRITNKLSINVYSSNAKANEYAYPNITVSKDNIPLYHQYLVTPNVEKVEVVTHFGEAIEWKHKAKIWVYYSHLASNNFWFISLPLWLNHNAWDVFVYSLNDNEKTPIFTLFKDGRVNTLWDLYYLEYATYGDYVVYNLKRRGLETTIGKLLIIPEENYVVK